MRTSSRAPSLTPDDCALAPGPGSPLSTTVRQGEQDYWHVDLALSERLSVAAVADCTTRDFVQYADEPRQTRPDEIMARQSPGEPPLRARTSGFVVLAQEIRVRPH